MLIDPETEKVHPINAEFAMVLGSAMATIYDDLLDSIRVVLEDDNPRESWLYANLPPVARANPSSIPFRHFLTTHCSLVDKALGAQPAQLACRAEEILLWLTLERAKEMGEEGTMEIKGNIPDLCDEYIDHVYEDTDFLFLYDPKMDGVEYNEALGTGSLKMEH